MENLKGTSKCDFHVSWAFPDFKVENITLGGREFSFDMEIHAPNNKTKIMVYRGCPGR
jgi:hypothetical protein